MSTSTLTRRYGWRPSLPDQRDLFYGAPRITTLPTSIDLRPDCPAVYDQGNLGSCTANAAAGAFEYLLKKQGLVDFLPSRQDLYYKERQLEHTTDYDSGASIADSVKVLHKFGVCPESDCPYDVATFTVKPSKQADQDALKHKASSYMRVQQHLPQMQACLAEGYPILVGFTVYSSFESDEVAKNGLVPMPGHGESKLGGHAVAVVGYHDGEQMFIVRNSWGADWGQEGYCMMPYAYLLSGSLASDFWTIRTVA